MSVRKDAPSNLLATEEEPIKSFYIELNLRNSKCLMNCFYNLQKNIIGTHLDRLSESLDRFSLDYEKIIMFGDFDIEITENHMKSFRENYDLKNLIKQPTCYKNPTNLTCINLLLTNVSRSFQQGCLTFI